MKTKVKNFSFFILIVTLSISLKTLSSRKIRERPHSRFERKKKFILEALDDLHALELNPKFLTRKEMVDEKKFKTKEQKSEMVKITQEEKFSPQAIKRNLRDRDHLETENPDTKNQSQRKKSSLGDMVGQLKVDDDELSTKTIDFHQKYITELQNELYKKGSFTEDQVRCLIIRRGLAFLPSYKPIKSNNTMGSMIYLAFTQQSGKMPNSFRSVVYDMFLQLALLNPEHPQSENDIKLITEIRKKKKEYKKEIIDKDPRMIRVSEDEETEIRNKLKKLSKTKNDCEKFLKKNYKVRTGYEEKLDGLADSMKETLTKKGETYEGLMAKRDEVSEARGVLKGVYWIYHVGGINMELVLSSGSLEEFLKMKKALVYKSKVQRMIFILRKLLDSRYGHIEVEHMNEIQIANQNFFLKTIDRLDDVMKAQEKLVANSQNAIDKNFGKIEAAFEKKMRQIANMDEFKSTFKKLKKLTGQILKKEKEALECQKKIDDLENLLAHRGIAHREEVDFIINDSEIEQYQNEYEFYIRILLKLESLKPLEEQVWPELENSKEIQEMRVDNGEREINMYTTGHLNPLETDNNKAFKQIQDFFTQVENLYRAKQETEVAEKNIRDIKRFFEIEIKYKTILKTTLEIATKRQPIIWKLFEFAKNRLEISKDIRLLENQVDQRLAEVFSEVYYLQNGGKCFADGQLGYDLFNLGKVNAIYDEGSFWESFFGTLAQSSARGFRDTKRMIIVYTSVFSSQESTIKLAKRLSEVQEFDLPEKYVNKMKGLGFEGEQGQKREDELVERNKKTLKSEIQNFTRSFDLMLDSYKDLTNYARDLLDHSSGEISKVYVRMKKLTIKFIKKNLEWNLSLGLGIVGEKIYVFILEFLLKLIKLSSYSGWLIAKGLSEYLDGWIRLYFTNMIAGFIEEKLGTMRLGIDDLGEHYGTLKDKMNSLSVKKGFKDLDWATLILNKKRPSSDDEDAISQVEGKLYEMEKMFWDMSQDESDPYTILESIWVEDFEGDGRRARVLESVGSDIRLARVSEEKRNQRAFLRGCLSLI